MSNTDESMETLYQTYYPDPYLGTRWLGNMGLWDTMSGLVNRAYQLHSLGSDGRNAFEETLYLGMVSALVQIDISMQAVHSVFPNEEHLPEHMWVTELFLSPSITIKARTPKWNYQYRDTRVSVVDLAYLFKNRVQFAVNRVRNVARKDRSMMPFYNTLVNLNNTATSFLATAKTILICANTAAEQQRKKNGRINLQKVQHTAKQYQNKKQSKERHIMMVEYPFVKDENGVIHQVAIPRYG